MADREKVIKGLEILINGCEYIDCGDCCFYISTKPTRCGLREEQIQEEALALLKEQEAVEPKITTLLKKDHDDSHIYRCGNCDMIIFKSHKYCPFCGKAVKWNA